MGVMGVLMPRVLYGLHELFVLLPYERGAKRARLALRASRLRTFLEARPAGYDYPPEMIGAPLVLAELSSLPGTSTAAMLVNGYMLRQMYADCAIAWNIRHHRTVWTIGGAGVRFETGGRLVFGTVTKYFMPLEILSMLKEGHASHAQIRTS